MTHEPLCYCSHGKPLSRDPFCHCELIAKVREDVVNRFVGAAQVHWDAGYAFGVDEGQRNMLAKCISAVEACGDDKGYVYSDTETGIEWAVAALRALQDQP
jgi:hypothetical protein